MRKKGTKNKNYSPEFKISVILDMRNNHLSYSETVRKYWGTQTKAETANYRFTLLSIIFKGAIAHGLMDKNPLNLVVRMKLEGKHGTALT